MASRLSALRLGRPSLVLGLAALAMLGAFIAAPARSAVRATAPPLHGFFAKDLDCGGIAVRSSAAVEDQALELACGKIAMMLRHIPEVRARLVAQGAELHVIGRHERTSDLPEFRAERGKLYRDNAGREVTIDERTRGKGGRLSSCGEENILRLPSDRYRGGSDICVHEFAHAVMNFGMTPAQRQRIEAQFQRSLAAGRWRDAYAGTNAREYWAELSMWYFGAHGDSRMQGSPPGDGASGLKAYDPEGYALLDALYHGGA
jgi:alpha-glucosidase